MRRRTERRRRRCGPARILCIDPATGREIFSLESPQAPLFPKLHIGPGGRHLVAAGESHVFQIWDLARIRRELAGMGLDWKAGSAAPPDPEARPLRVTVDLGLPAEASAEPPPPQEQQQQRPSP